MLMVVCVVFWVGGLALPNGNCGYVYLLWVNVVVMSLCCLGLGWINCVCLWFDLRSGLWLLAGLCWVGFRLRVLCFWRVAYYGWLLVGFMVVGCCVGLLCVWSVEFALLIVLM